MRKEIEPHKRGAILVAAVFEAFRALITADFDIVPTTIGDTEWLSWKCFAEVVSIHAMYGRCR